MGDLILKPASGGDLILQEDGGSASLTIDTSGNTTLAGTANNIGTVTSGTFNGTIGDSATFPDVSKNVPAFEVYRSGNQALTSQVDAKVSFDHVSFDTNNAYDENTNYRFTTPTGS